MDEPTHEVPGDWFEGFFEHEWLDLIALQIPPERTTAQVDFVAETLELEPGADILDLACGHGRHSLELARRGYRVTGVDLSRRSIELASQAANDEQLDVRFVEGDMREIDFEDEFDAVVNLFTAFGYFEQEADDQLVLHAVSRALRAGGSFLIDVINPLALARRYQERMWEEHGEAVMLAENVYDFLTGRNRSTWTFVYADGRRSQLVHSLRMYTAAELARMLDGAGLELTGAWGSFDGSQLGFDQSRSILRARKRG